MQWIASGPLRAIQVHAKLLRTRFQSRVQFGQRPKLNNQSISVQRVGKERLAGRSVYGLQNMWLSVPVQGQPPPHNDKQVTIDEKGTILIEPDYKPGAPTIQDLDWEYRKTLRASVPLEFHWPRFDLRRVPA